MKKFVVVVAIVLVALAVVGGYFLLMPKGNKTPGKVYHVGILSGLGVLDDTTDGFKSQMTELGYIEGTNIIYDIQKTEFDLDKYKSIIKKFVNDKVDLIFVFPTEASQEAKKITEGTGIPVVFANAFTEDTGLVNNIREPGGNITGVRWGGPDLALQRFEIMRQMVPNAKRMIIIYQKGYPIVKSQMEALRPVAVKAGITLIEVPAGDAAELESELQKLPVNSSTDSVLAIAEPLLGSAWDVVGRFAKKNKLPVGSGLGSGTPDPTSTYDSIFDLLPQAFPQGKQAAFLADKVLKGIPAGTLPVISAENYLTINYKAAQKLGLNVPEGLLSRAKEIIH
jgi:putative ABC transport system substrate-binding protein